MYANTLYYTLEQGCGFLVHNVNKNRMKFELSDGLTGCLTLTAALSGCESTGLMQTLLLREYLAGSSVQGTPKMMIENVNAAGYVKMLKLLETYSNHKKIKDYESPKTPQSSFGVVNIT